MRPGKRDAVAHLVPDELDYGNVEAGAFHWTGLYGVEDPGPFGMCFGCPCGCGMLHGVSFDNRPVGWGGDSERKHPVWHWDGNKEKPTLSPSLGLLVTPNMNTVGPDGHYHWHGFLRTGVFEEC